MRRLFISICLLMTWCLCSAQVHLDQKIDLQVSNVSVPKALIALSESANISIAFQSALFDPTAVVNLNLTNEDFQSVLNKCLEGTNVAFRIEDNHIILFRKEGKKYTISGYIQDSESGERLVLATIISGQRSTISNDYGYYSISHPEGAVKLSGDYIGYEGDPISFNLTSDTIINLMMDPYLTLSAVTIVDSEINNNDRRFRIGKGRVIVTEDISSQPALGGETDIYRYLQSQAGVQGGADGLGGLNVRGGNAEHNLVLLDGVPVFNPSHSLGLFSIFNSNTIKSIRFVKDGFSARYGGRLASVVDVRTKEGNTQKTTGEIEIGTIATKGIIELPIVKNKSALLISGRRTHIDPFLKKYSRDKKFENFDEGETNYSFFDINAKFHSSIGSKDKIYLSYYRGQDDFRDQSEWEGIYVDEDTNEESDGYSFQGQELFWSNELSSFRWNHVFGNNLFANLTGTYSRYNYRSFNDWEDSSIGDLTTSFDAVVIDTKSQVIDYGVRLDLDHYVSESHQLKYGGAVLFRDFVPGTFLLESEVGEIDVEGVQAVLDTFGTSLSYEATEYSGYLEDKIKLSDKSALLIGLRVAAFQAKSKTYVEWMPRLSIGFDLDDHWSARLSTARSTQFLHVLSSSDAGLPTDLWVPSTDNVGPQQAWQQSAGLTGNWPSGWSVDVGLYYKTMTGLLTYNENVKQPGLVEIDPLSWEDDVSVGTGTSYGAELSITQSKGKNRGSLNYTYSKSERKFGNVNGGVAFPFSFDRPHSINLQFAHYFNDRINLQLGWQFSSGRPITLQRTEFRFVALSNSLDDFEPASSTNGHRLSDYHRLDINLQLKLGSGSTRHLLNLGVYNVYNQKNPYYQYLLNDEFEGRESSEQLNALPLVPSISYKIQFGQ